MSIPRSRRRSLCGVALQRSCEQAAIIGELQLADLLDLKSDYVAQQRRSSILLPPQDAVQFQNWRAAACGLDAFNLEALFKRYFESNWGEWGTSACHFDPRQNTSIEYLRNCVLLQWRVESRKESPEEPFKYYDKSPVVWHTRSSENNFQRKEGPSLQVCLLGLDPCLLDHVTFEASIVLRKDAATDEERHCLELMRREGSEQRDKPIVEPTVPGQEVPDAVEPADVPSRSRKRPRTRAIAALPGAAKHPWMECSWKNASYFNNFDDVEMRGCEGGEEDVEERRKQCIVANFPQLGISRASDQRLPGKAFRSRVMVKVEMHFRNIPLGHCVTVTEYSNPFIVSPGKEKTKDSELFLNYAWEVMTEVLDQGPAYFPQNLANFRPIKWAILRNFFKVAYKAQNIEIRELDKEELLLLQTKLFSQRRALPSIGALSPGAQWERNGPEFYIRQEEFINDDEDIYYRDITKDKAHMMVSVVDGRTPVKHCLWEWMTTAYSKITSNTVNRGGEDEKNSEIETGTEERQLKMRSLFNRRLITMTPRLFALRVFRMVVARIGVVNQSSGAGDDTSRSRCILLRFDDDNANFCSIFYTNVSGREKGPMKNHTLFDNILNTKGGFWNFFNYPFSRKFNRIIQLLPKLPSEARVGEEATNALQVTFLDQASTNIPHIDDFPVNQLYPEEKSPHTLYTDYGDTVAAYHLSNDAPDSYSQNEQQDYGITRCVLPSFTNHFNSPTGVVSQNQVYSRPESNATTATTDVREERLDKRSADDYWFSAKRIFNKDIRLRDGSMGKKYGIFGRIGTETKQEFVRDPDGFEVDAQLGQPLNERDVEDAEDAPSELFDNLSIRTPHTSIQFI